MGAQFEKDMDEQTLKLFRRLAERRASHLTHEFKNMAPIQCLLSLISQMRTDSIGLIVKARIAPRQQNTRRSAARYTKWTLVLMPKTRHGPLTQTIASTILQRWEAERP
jgi:hypothetical protein